MNDTGTTALVKVLDGALAKSETIDFVRRVREVVDTVMQNGIHYGKVPGTDRRSLWQPGAEVLDLAFRFAPTYVESDLSLLQAPGEDPRRAVYRFATRCRLIHSPSGMLVAEGVGEASTEELRYKWRRPANRGEYDDTPEEFRTKKYLRGSAPEWALRAGIAENVAGGHALLLVRTNPADLANTVRSMSAKRARVKATRSATAASDAFSDGLEELVDAGIDPGEHENGEPERAPVEPPKASPPPQPTPNGNGREIKCDPEAAERVGANVPVEAWQRVRSAWHDRKAISTAQVNRLLAIAAQTHERCGEASERCPSCRETGVPALVRSGWRFDDVRNVVLHNLEVAPEELPIGEPYNLVAALFDRYSPAE